MFIILEIILKRADGDCNKTYVSYFDCYYNKLFVFSKTPGNNKCCKYVNKRKLVLISKYAFCKNNRV